MSNFLLLVFKCDYLQLLGSKVKEHIDQETKDTKEKASSLLKRLDKEKEEQLQLKSLLTSQQQWNPGFDQLVETLHNNTPTIEDLMLRNVEKFTRKKKHVFFTGMNYSVSMIPALCIAFTLYFSIINKIFPKSPYITAMVYHSYGIS